MSQSNPQRGTALYISTYETLQDVLITISVQKTSEHEAVREFGRFEPWIYSQMSRLRSWGKEVGVEQSILDSLESAVDPTCVKLKDRIHGRLSGTLDNFKRVESLLEGVESKCCLFADMPQSKGVSLATAEGNITLWLEEIDVSLNILSYLAHSVLLATESGPYAKVRETLDLEGFFTSSSPAPRDLKHVDLESIHPEDKPEDHEEPSLLSESNSDEAFSPTDPMLLSEPNSDQELGPPEDIGPTVPAATSLPNKKNPSTETGDSIPFGVSEGSGRREERSLNAEDERAGMYKSGPGNDKIQDVLNACAAELDNKIAKLKQRVEDARREGKEDDVKASEFQLRRKERRLAIAKLEIRLHSAKKDLHLDRKSKTKKAIVKEIEEELKAAHAFLERHGIAKLRIPIPEPIDPSLAKISRESQRGMPRA